MGLSWSDTTHTGIRRLCQHCRHDWPGHRIPCDLGEPRAYLGNGFAGCADHEALPAVEREAETVALAAEGRAMPQAEADSTPQGLDWLATLGIWAFWLALGAVGVWLWQRGL